MQVENQISNIPSSSTQTALIPPQQRWWFLLLFTLMTILGWIVGGFASMMVEETLLKTLPDASGSIWISLARYITSSIVFATIFAVSQVLVLHRYISGWLWIISMSAGWVIFNSVAASWKGYILNFAQSSTLSSNQILALTILSTFAYNLSAIWLGFGQYLVLRRRAAKVWWWNFIPVISFCFISIFVWVLSVLQEFIPEENRALTVYASEQVLTALILGIVPALGFCVLKKK